MTINEASALLERFRNGEIGREKVLHRFQAAPVADLGFAQVDTHRALRKGFPEVIFGAGKTPHQVVRIAEKIYQREQRLLITRITKDHVRGIRRKFKHAMHHETARCLTIEKKPLAKRPGIIAILCAGTSDLPVAEEAAVTADIMGNRVERLSDVGVAGLHRLLSRLELIQSANVLIVVAGMEGALPSVVAGLVARPVIAVPTSVGYGASFGGIAALLGMMNSCGSGVTVVNIDNGFGAGYAASQINELAAAGEGIPVRNFEIEAPMKTLYLDIFSGISGDMFLGAMIDLGLDAQALEGELEKLNLDGWHIHVERGQKSSISGIKFDVHLSHEDVHSHEHTHPGGTTHAHPHSPAHGHQEHAHGSHGEPLLKISQGQVELSVFETNVTPRFRLYFYDAAGKAVDPPAPNTLMLETIRPDKRRRSFKFKRQDDCLEATDFLPEPHEFTAILKLKRGSRIEKREIQFIEDHHHPHGNERGAEHAHGRNFADIKKLIQASTLSDWVKEKSIAVFHRIAVAEGKIHDQPAAEVHFHEVGAIDSIVDIVGACVALELLGKPRVLAAPVVEGSGWINCAHGRFPLPAPATLAILGARGIAITQCEEPHELVTPTGAALLAEFVEHFGPMQGLIATRIGHGLGTRDNRTRPNILRAVLGEVSSSIPFAHNDWVTDTVAVLETNLDDINAEILGHFVERAFAAGALDVFHTPIQMKKNRPGVLLTLLCADGAADKFAELILRETSAFGVRRHSCERRKLQRELITVQTAYGEISVKLGRLNGRTIQASPEFESCKKVAVEKNVPLKEVYEAVSRALKNPPEL